MAAQAKSNICERCFANVKSTDHVCPECGAPLNSEGPSQAADSAMHAELAQANLFRLRGDREAAEKQCLSILKRYPNEPEAHSLLAELSADKGDYARAIEWYELALDLNPNSSKDRARLEELKNRSQSAETAQAVEQLGLPTQTNILPWIIGFVVLVALIVGVKALWPVHREAKNNIQGGGIVDAPRSDGARQITSGSVDTTATSNPDANSGSSDSGASYAALPMEDRTLMQSLQKGPSGDTISSVEQDPRDKTITITFSVAKAEDARHTGAILAKEALDRSADSLIVTVRGISGDRLIFVADGSRPRLSEIEAQSSQDLQNGNDTWISNFLQREWPAPASAPATTTPPATGTPPANISPSSPATTTGGTASSAGTSAAGDATPPATHA